MVWKNPFLFIMIYRKTIPMVMIFLMLGLLATFSYASETKSPVTKKTQPSLLLITIDTLRADRLQVERVTRSYEDPRVGPRPRDGIGKAQGELFFGGDGSTTTGKFPATGMTNVFHFPFFPTFPSLPIFSLSSRRIPPSL